MLTKMQIESDALQVCMGHALSTEKEEVMGLLVGEVVVELYEINSKNDNWMNSLINRYLHCYLESLYT